MAAKILTSLMALLGLTALTMGQECGGALSTTPFDAVLDLNHYYGKCTFQKDKLNSSCILASCPLLKGLCPMNSTSALNTAVSIINQCLGQKDLICGLNMSSSPMVQLGWTTAQVLPVNVASGTVWLNPGTGFLNNLSNAKFSVANSTGQKVTLVIEATNITSTAYYNCTFNIPSASFVSPVVSLIKALVSLNTDNMYGAYHLNVSSTVAIDLSAQPPTIAVTDDHSSDYVQFDNLFTANEDPLLQEIVQTFNEAMNSFLLDSQVYEVAAIFLATYAALGLQGAQEGCS